MPDVRHFARAAIAAALVLGACTGGREQVRPTEDASIVLTDEERKLQQERAATVAEVREELAGAREEVAAEREAQARKAEQFAQTLPESPVWTFRGTITGADARTLTIEDGKGNRRELTLDGETVLAGSGPERPFGAEPVREGAEVRATYVLEKNGLVARRIEVLRSAGAR